MFWFLPLPSHAQDVPPNVILLLDNSESMQDFPQYLPEVFTPGYYPTPSNPAPGDLGGVGSAGMAINTGCSDPALVSAMSWFDANSSDPAKNGSVVYDSDPDLASPFFNPNAFYFTRGRRIAWMVKEYPSSLSLDTRQLDYSYGDALNACYSQVGWDIEDYPFPYSDSSLIAECVSCLNTKGWWRGPMVNPATVSYQHGPVREPGEPQIPPEAYRKWVVSGRVLNVRPPKFVIARKVIKDVIKSVTHTRLGVATFGRDHGWFDPPELLAPLRPTCEQSHPTFDETAMDRPGLMKAVNNMQYRNNERSIGEALFGLGGYYSSQQMDGKWEKWFKQPLSPGYFGWPGCCNGGTYDDPYTGKVGLYWGMAPDEWLKQPRSDPSTGAYLPGQPWEEPWAQRRSTCFRFQTNAVIVVSGGTPRSDNTVPITKMMELLMYYQRRHDDGSLLRFDPVYPEVNPDVGGVNYCDLVGSTKEACDYTEYNWPTGLGVGNKNFMDDVAFFLSHMDLRDDMPAIQTMRTFVVGYGDSSPMLQSIALAGKGSFFRADSTTELRDAILYAIGQSHTSTSSAP
ncbi:VWA domain-containing protein [Vitiosangium sp. GDMCC 1.1324]|uniref:vWA domain-containing protein n=1 Tax=Vitiosangium sp. (strain GDMCC 1.1324) TaxID=2138576 RepID=UPI000D379390|nr:VWA domain-containing protein [Vitiosangium sp. GDMCC 1.1324]PTL79976.1 hypothetical protein DAT35_31640 [Vitiosangium sp. GDMCC 1.1324]